MIYAVKRIYYRDHQYQIETIKNKLSFVIWKMSRNLPSCTLEGSVVINRRTSLNTETFKNLKKCRELQIFNTKVWSF